MTAALRILHVTPYYEEAWAYGGIPRVASRLARGLARRGHEVTVCTTDACDVSSRLSARSSEGAGGGGVPVRVFPNLSNRVAYHLQLYTPRGMAAWLRSAAGDFDVAHLHGCHHLPGALAARELARVGVPYLVQPNGTAPRRERRRLAKWAFDHTFERGLLPRAARVLAVSKAEKRDLLGLGVPAARVHLLPNPLDLGELEPRQPRGWLRERWALGHGPVVLYLGMLTPRKGVDVLVEAFSRLAAPDARLVLAGNDRGIGRQLERLVRRRGLAGTVVFTGLLRGAERLAALTGADVVAYPPRHDAFGLVPLEALLCGTPVVVGDDHGCGEVIAAVGGGRRVPPGDAAGLAAALADLLAAPAAWRQRAQAAAGVIARRFATDVVCAGLDELYREVIAAADDTTGSASESRRLRGAPHPAS
jgi:glycosyltransferase involved in cell wall biosynthesis